MEHYPNNTHDHFHLLNVLHIPRVCLVLLAITLISCVTILPVSASGSWIAAGISSDPPASTLNASGYEKEALAFQAEENWSGVLATSKEGLDYYPDDAELMCLEAYALRKTGHYQESINILNRAIPLDPRPARYTNRAYGLLASGRYQEALNDTNSAIAMNRSYAAAWDAQAMAFLGLGNLTGAGEATDTAILLAPDSAHAWQVKGEVLSKSGNCSGAIAAYQRSIAINPDYSLPWPGMMNATQELKKEEAACAGAGAHATAKPTTTRAGMPGGLVFIAIGIFILVTAWKDGK